MYKKVISGLVIYFSFVVALRAATPIFLNSSFDSFMKQIVLPEHRQKFEAYYHQMKRKLKKLKVQKKQSKKFRTYKNKINELQRIGFSSLQVKKPILAEQVRVAKNQAMDDQEERINKFLRNCGIYEKFIEHEANRHQTVWAKTKNYMRNASNSVVSWFNSWRKPSTTTV